MRADAKRETFFRDWQRKLSPTGNPGDAIFRVVLLTAAGLMLVIVGGMILALAAKSLPSIRHFGFSFLTTSEWNPVTSEFGALAFI